MPKLWLGLGGVLVATACLSTPSVAALPSPPPGVFLAQVHQTGTVGPKYFHRDTLLVQADGTWTASRAFPYSSPPYHTLLATGSLSETQLGALQARAAAQPTGGGTPFDQLPSSEGQMRPGGGQREIALTLASGQVHQVTVFGEGPPAFEQLDSAIASATVDMATIGPSQAL